jgi:hypothetical protein
MCLLLPCFNYAIKFSKDEREDGFTVAIMGVRSDAYRILIGNHGRECCKILNIYERI